jgi:hypothetical protein
MPLHGNNWINEAKLGFNRESKFKEMMRQKQQGAMPGKTTN